MNLDDNSHSSALDRFLADNPELEELSAALGSFNILRVLKIEKAEIRHSNVLGWLLDPAGSHGLGDVVLRRILSNLLLESDSNFDAVTPSQVELMDFGEIEVRREWRHIDLLVIDRRNSLVILVENKILSGESKGQLDRYLEAVATEFLGFTVVPVFLTLAGDETADEEETAYLPYSYAQILAVLDRITDQRRTQIPEEVLSFLNDYRDALRKLTMQDEKLIELCKTIYRRHREAIDLIVEYGAASVMQQVIEEELQADGEYEIPSSTAKRVFFLPEIWSRWVPSNGDAWRGLKTNVSVAAWFYLRPSGERIHLAFELTRMDDAELRLACANALKEVGFRLTKKALERDAKFSRFFSASGALEDPTDQEEVRRVVRRLLGKAKAEFPRVEEVLKPIFRKAGV